MCFKSIHFPGECVATRRGSPLLVGIKTKTRLATDYVPILYGKGENLARYIYLYFFFQFSGLRHYYSMVTAFETFRLVACLI